MSTEMPHKQTNDEAQATSRKLAGVTVLIGRPTGMGERWRTAFETLGADVAHQPALRIDPVNPDKAALRSLETFSADDSAVFSSRPGVEHGLALPNLKQQLGQGTCWAVGRQTARALVQAGMPRVRCPASGYGADALLADPEFPASSRVWLFGAQGGRTIIGKTLAQRGSVVTPIWVYQRSPAPLESNAQRQLAEAKKRGPIVVIASSVAVLQRLLELHGEVLTDQRLVSLGQRITRAARQHSFATVVTATSPDLPSVIEAARLAARHDAR